MSNGGQARRGAGGNNNSNQRYQPYPSTNQGNNSTYNNGGNSRFSGAGGNLGGDDFCQLFNTSRLDPVSGTMFFCPNCSYANVQPKRAKEGHWYWKCPNVVTCDRTISGKEPGKFEESCMKYEKNPVLKQDQGQQQQQNNNLPQVNQYIATPREEQGQGQGQRGGGGGDEPQYLKEIYLIIKDLAKEIRQDNSNHFHLLTQICDMLKQPSSSFDLTSDEVLDEEN